MPLGQVEAGVGQNQYGLIPITLLQLATGTVPPDAVVVDNFRSYDYTINDNSDFQFTVPEDYLPGTNLTMIMDWACNEAYALANGEINWRIAWETVATNLTQAVGTGTAGTVDSGDINIPAVARTLTTVSFTLTAADFAALDLCRILLTRIALVGGVSPTAEPEVYAVNIRYTRRWPYVIR